MNQGSLLRHKWIVWLYSPTGHPSCGPGVPIRRGTIVSSRRAAKRIATNHASKAPGNKSVWCRWSYSIRGRHAQRDYIQFADVIATHTSDGAVSRVLCDLSAQEFVWQMKHPYCRNRYARAARNRHVIGKRHEV